MKSESVIFREEHEFCVVEYFANGIVSVTLSRAELRNAFNAPMISELTGVFQRISHIATKHGVGECEARDVAAGLLHSNGLPAGLPTDYEARILVLQGSGKVFCAGADLSYMQSLALVGEQDNIADAMRLGQLFMALAVCPLPVVCVVQGAAIGGGFGLAVCADFVLAEAQAQFATTEVCIGLVPGVISPFIQRKLGLAAAQQFMLTGKRFSAVQCVTFGLVTQVVNDTNALPDALHEFNLQLLQCGPNALRVTKQLTLLNSPLPSQKVLAQAAGYIANVRASKEGREGIEAFLKKRKPSWQES